ncbi:hypothetical protein J2Z42_000883 [Clostridium algifaecis]|uniref:Uncharacterized protein n=1 Tax=Clostridium algifaecis TaxID=1472040 RepID=A0ABS4KQA5_9CLOT|nr:hypothetical protein [Clostridium algifaecis]
MPVNFGCYDIIFVGKKKDIDRIKEIKKNVVK